MVLGDLQRERGTPQLILSDNAKTFKAAKQLLNKLYRLFKDEKVKGYISRNRIEWKFILAKSPWMAGFYERIYPALFANMLQRNQAC